MKSIATLIAIYLYAVAACFAAPVPVDIWPQINTAKAGAVIDLKPGTYSLSQQAVIVRAITIRGHGSTLIAPAEHGVFDCHATVVVDGFVCTKANIFMHVNTGVKDCELSNCTLSNVLNAVKVEDGGGICKCENVKAQSNSVTYYGTVSLLHCTGRSVGEYAVRLEGDGQSLIAGGEYSNAGNAFGKDTIGARQGSGIITGATIHGNIRIGQEPPSGPPMPTGSASRLQVSDCTFLDQSPGHTYIEVKQGCEVWEWGNTWMQAKLPAIAKVSTGSVLHHSAPTTQPTK